MDGCWQVYVDAERVKNGNGGAVIVKVRIKFPQSAPTSVDASMAHTVGSTLHKLPSLNWWSALTPDEEFDQIKAPE